MGAIARLSTGKVDCWGYNLYGEIGNRTFNGPDGTGGAGYDTPQTVTGITDATFIASDSDHSYSALLSTRRVVCWGYVGAGQLGNGATPHGWDGYNTPQTVKGITDAVSVYGDGLGQGDYCAILSTGGVDCWGDNGNGELGNGTIGGPLSGGYDTPQAVIHLTHAVSVVSDDSYQGGRCALLSTGGVECWGDNLLGEVGNGTTGGPDGRDGADYDTPQAVVGITNAVSVTGELAGSSEGASLGGYCAVLSTGRVVCWGDNRDGEMGKGTRNGPDGQDGQDYGYDTPQAVANITNAVSVTSEGDDYCAVLSTGGVECWGDNAGGKLGNGTTGGLDGGGSYDTPRPVTGITNATSVASGPAISACALLVTHRVDCWGDDAFGELGNGTTGGPDGGQGYDTPQAVVGIADATSITNSGSGYCALLSTSQVKCWGYDYNGQLGNGTVRGPDGSYNTPQTVR